ncbi:MAG: hypothetical protein KatS3mg085_818 [Candidatus Dojkabacteria bacterium]|nr:MAG: hypothetical protein KatS3mg085_818 [Candidatus Dojkabacteria bacterium]
MKFLRKFFGFIFFIVFFVGVSVAIVATISNFLGLMTFEEFSNWVKDQTRGQNEKSFQIGDDRILEISFNDSLREIYESQTAITIKSNKPILLEPNDRQQLFFVKNRENIYYYVLEFNNIGIGESTLRFKLLDEAYQNVPGDVDIEIPSFAEQSFELKVKRVQGVIPFGASYIEDWENAQYVVAESTDLLVQVDKNHKLVDDYDPGDLLNVSTDLLLYANTPDILIRKDAGEALRTMILDAQNQTGKTLTVLSAYRSFNNQVQTYASNVSKYGQDEADKISARPGFSEHQLGTTVDFYSPDTGNDIFSQNFLETEIGKWLSNNAYKYGFVLTLDQNQSMYQFEPWHWRYIGVENAKQYIESGQNFFDWLNSIQ